jgi:hypothetical protein
MHSTITDHWSIVKIIPWYLKQTTNHGLVLTCGNILIFKPFQMLIGQVQLIGLFEPVSVKKQFNYFFLNQTKHNQLCTSGP